MRYALIAICLMLAGCDRDESSSTSGGASGGHSHAAPHGGVLAELGEHEAAAEVTLDRATGTLDLYLLDSHAENPVRIAQETIRATVDVRQGEKVEIELKSVASELTGEKAGDSSQFRGQHEKLVTPGQVRVELGEMNLRGKTYDGVNVDIPAAGGNAP